MHGVVYDYLSADHDRLDALLESATSNRAAVDMATYSEFRKGLLRHISIEEKIVLPAIAKWQGGRKSALANRLRLDHSAIASLLVPPPSRSIILTLRSILTVHNALEEGEAGLYEHFEALAGSEAEAMLDKFKAAPDVLVLPHNEQPDALEVTKRSVLRAGYEFKNG